MSRRRLGDPRQVGVRRAGQLGRLPIRGGDIPVPSSPGTRTRPTSLFRSLPCGGGGDLGKDDMIDSKAGNRTSEPGAVS